MIRVLAWPIGSSADRNPYVTLMYRAFVPPNARLIAFRPLMRIVPQADVFHLQWPEGIFEGRAAQVAPLTVLKALRILAVARRVRRSGGIVALTAHNLVPHGVLGGWRRLLYDRYFQLLANEIDLVVALTGISLEQYRARYPTLAKARAVIIPHPHYCDSYDWSTSRAEARIALGLNVATTVIGIIGSIRRSKRVPDAISLFRRIAREDEMLLVRGDCADEALWSSITVAANQDPRVVLMREPLDDRALAITLCAIDRSLVFQTSTLNSGTVLLALSAGRGVLAPKIGSLPELADHVGESWLSLIEVGASDEEHRRALDRLNLRSGAADLSAFNPDRLSCELLHTFVEAIADKAGSRE